MKKRYGDILVIVMLDVILIILSETGNMGNLVNLTFATVYDA